MPKRVTQSEMIGVRFGRLIVESFAEGLKPPQWNCFCDCGNKCTRRTGALRDVSTQNKSCGCAKKDSIAKASSAAWKVTTKFSHTHKKTLKWTFRNMVNRCHKPGTRRYERYGGRGISVCEEWRTNPTAFFEWAISNGYEHGLWIERNDVNGNYCPSNCSWKTQKEQANNTSRNRFLTWNGETLTIAQWADKIGESRIAIQHRVERGWSAERIFTQPFRQ